MSHQQLPPINPSSTESAPSLPLHPEQPEHQEQEHPRRGIIDPRIILQIQQDKRELDAMFLARAQQQHQGATTVVNVSSSWSAGQASLNSTNRMKRSILKTTLHKSVLGTDNGGGVDHATTTVSPRQQHKRRSTTTFQASMNFQDAPKRFKAMPKRPEEGLITWSNVYDSQSLTDIPKVKVDETRGPLLFLGTSSSHLVSSSHATPQPSLGTHRTHQDTNNTPQDRIHGRRNSTNSNTAEDEIAHHNSSWKDFEAAMTASPTHEEETCEQEDGDDEDDDEVDDDNNDDDDDDDNLPASGELTDESLSLLSS
jgi:hypothetical protein